MGWMVYLFSEAIDRAIGCMVGSSANDVLVDFRALVIVAVMVAIIQPSTMLKKPMMWTALVFGAKMTPITDDSRLYVIKIYALVNLQLQIVSQDFIEIPVMSKANISKQIKQAY